MPGRAHETLVEALHDRPTLLAALVYALTGHTIAPELKPVDSTIRFVKVDEVRPDILYESAPGWTITEVQNDIDPEKQRRWLLAAAVLFNQTGVLGDVYVITAERPVATWALTVAHLETPRGTKLALTPVVLHVSPEVLDRLLSEEHPELALVATWAVSHRHGPKAKKVVERAIELTERLPPPLQKTQRDAILNLLSERMLAWLKEKAMNPKSRLSPAVLEFKAAIGGPYRACRGAGRGARRGRAEGAADAAGIPWPLGDGGGAGDHRGLLGSGGARSVVPAGRDGRVGGGGPGDEREGPGGGEAEGGEAAAPQSRGLRSSGRGRSRGGRARGAAKTTKAHPARPPDGRPCDRLGRRDDRLRTIDDRLGRRDDRLRTIDDRLGRRDDRLRTIDDRLGRRDERLRTIDDRLGRRDERLRTIGQSVRTIDESFGRRDDRLRTIDDRLGRCDESVRTIDERLGRRDERPRTIDESVRTIDESLGRRDERLRTIDQSVRTIDESFGRRDERPRTIGQSVRTIDESFGRRDESLDRRDERLRTIDESFGPPCAGHRGLAVRRRRPSHGPRVRQRACGSAARADRGRGPADLHPLEDRGGRTGRAQPGELGGAGSSALGSPRGVVQGRHRRQDAHARGACRGRAEGAADAAGELRGLSATAEERATIELARDRLAAALRTLYLLFDEGYWSGDDEAPIRADLCRLAIGLARSVAEAFPDEPEARGLLSLLLLHDARRPAHLDPEGRPIPLPNQDRTRWDHAAITTASALLQDALRRGPVGPFQIEAAISAVHCRAPTADATDWREIAVLYALLEAHRPTALVRAQRAFAVARAEGAAAGLALLDADAAAQAPLIHGALLAELGQLAEARRALARAAAAARNRHERAQIEARIAALPDRRGDHVKRPDKPPLGRTPSSSSCFRRAKSFWLARRIAEDMKGAISLEKSGHILPALAGHRDPARSAQALRSDSVPAPRPAQSSCASGRARGAS